jgi:hypothetical protein
MKCIPAQATYRSMMAWLFFAAAYLLLAKCAAWGQSVVPVERTAELAQHLDDLTNKLEEMRQQLKQSQDEMNELRAELRGLRSQLSDRKQSEEAEQSAADLRTSIEQLKERTEVTESQIKQHDQTKVESASKYPLRISGMLLFTSVWNSGSSDLIDVPVVATAASPNDGNGSLTATARQTILGIDAMGPRLWGAKTFADITADFFGSVSYSGNSTAANAVRLRTSHARVEWPRRSISFAYDRPLLSPWQPTSWLSMGEPALAWSGNLWNWSPQFQFRENGILSGGHLSAEFGLIDPAPPATAQVLSSATPTASERSHQPGYEGRLSSSSTWHGHAMNVGAGGYYGRQTYSYSRHVDAWAATADWNLFVAPRVSLSGEIYRGRAISGLGGGAFKDYVTYNSYASLRGLNAEGGWAQAKVAFTSYLEANVAAGIDDALANDLRSSDLATEQNSYVNLTRNRNIYGNIVFRPRAYLLFSGEYRELQSWPIAGSADVDHIFGLAAGYLF